MSERAGGDDPELEGLHEELRGLLREVEERVEAKIEALRRLIAEAEKVTADLGGAVAAAVKVLPEPEPSPPPLVDVLVGGAPEGIGNPAPESLQGKILSLFRAGKPRDAIAEEVGVPRGEVDLVLNLHRATMKRPTPLN